MRYRLFETVQGAAVRQYGIWHNNSSVTWYNTIEALQIGNNGLGEAVGRKRKEKKGMVVRWEKAVFA
ncbi:MAG: hypothetical protein HFH75_18295 [Lachnospiraceae bacterium]|nr:hypothetical protein [Lachnospiraceae bacterium]